MEQMSKNENLQCNQLFFEKRPVKLNFGKCRVLLHTTKSAHKISNFMHAVMLFLQKDTGEEIRNLME